jgi:hypothetical protein
LLAEIKEIIAAPPDLPGCCSSATSATAPRGDMTAASPLPALTPAGAMRDDGQGGYR